MQMLDPAQAAMCTTGKGSRLSLQEMRTPSPTTMPGARESILAARRFGPSALPAIALSGDILPDRVAAAGLPILRSGAAVTTLDARPA